MADFNGDGRVDIWTGGRVLHNQSEGGNWIEIAAQGLNSNRDGVGAKVEVKTTHRLQKREIRSEGYAGVLHFGLAQSDSVEFIRILWPGGVRQTELATGAGQRLELTELDRKGTSCPILYAWDGERYRFVTDILGGAIIGYLTAPGSTTSPTLTSTFAWGRWPQRRPLCLAIGEPARGDHLRRCPRTYRRRSSA